MLAWQTSPGFFDQQAPPERYRWVTPPPGVPNSNHPPTSGHLTLGLDAGGHVRPDTVFTGELQPQASLSVVPAAFPAQVTIDIKPQASYPPTTGLQCETNVYLITATQPLQKPALVTLRYSDAVPAPSDIYRASPTGGGTWTRIGANGGSAAFYISAKTDRLGDFAACYASSANRPPGGGLIIGGGQTLPVLTLLAILLVLVGGIPLAALRRRER